MASSILHCFFFLFIFFAYFSGSNAATIKPKARAFILPVRKDNLTKQYYTSIDMGSSLVSLDVVIDLGAQFLWINCVSYRSSSNHPVPCGSTKCKMAEGAGCVGCNGAPRPGCTNNTCGVFSFNPFNDKLVASGLGEDTMAIYSTDGVRSMHHVNVPKLPFACADSDQLNGLAGGTQGMLGLARTRITLPPYLASTFKIERKFALCIPSSSEKDFGDIYIGGGPYYIPPFTKDISKLLTFTSLITNPVSTAPIYSEGDPSDEYFISVKSINIDGKAVSFNTTLLSIDKNGVGGTKISTRHSSAFLHLQSPDQCLRQESQIQEDEKK